MQEDAMPATIRRVCAADVDAIAARQAGRSGQDPARLRDRIAAELNSLAYGSRAALAFCFRHLRKIATENCRRS